jgi:hypothetical protein
MFTFLSPLFLIGLASAAIPLIIHLSRSRRTKKMRFSTTRFFTDQFLRSYRMSRLKELFLLACRMALCAILAMALAQPLVMPKGIGALGAGTRTVVVVLDNSASMGYVEDGQTLFDRAKAAARELVAGLRPGDTASVVLAGRRASGPEVLFAEPTPGLGDVLEALNHAQVACLGTDLPGALARAELIAAASSAPNKEVYLLSDLQDSGWDLSEATAHAPTDCQVAIIRIRPKTVANVAVTAVQHAPARPIAGVPLAIRPHLTVQGEPARPCTIRLFIYNKDGKAEKVGERQMDEVRPGRWPAPRFYHTFATGGWHAGYVEVGDDALALDNRRYFAFNVLEAARILAINGSPARDPARDELFFLKAALTVNAEGQNPLQVETIAPPALDSTNLDAINLIILANVESLTPAAVEKLESFTDRGGSLLVFLGGKVNPAFYNQTLAGPTRPHGGLLPARLRAVEGNSAKTDQFAFVADVAHDHPALAAFSDPQLVNWSSVSFKALWAVDPSEARVLMRASSGVPLLLEKQYGKGRVMLFASSCDRKWTNFPMRPAFLPWLHGIVAYLAQEPLGRQAPAATGDVLRLPTSTAEALPQARIKKPDGTTGFATSTGDAQEPLVFADTEQAGIYQLWVSEKEEKPALVAVNLERYESDLTGLDEVFAEQTAEASGSREEQIAAGFRKLLGRATDDYRVSYVDDPVHLTQHGTLAAGLKLWDYLLAAVLLIALLEPWLANHISQRHYGRPREALHTHWAQQ